MSSPSVFPETQIELARFRNRLEASILPFWSGEGFDRAHGLFHERFDFAGRPIEASPRRAMVQARQIFVFSHAALGRTVPSGADLVGRALRSLLVHYGDGDSGFAFAIHPDGTVQQPMRDSYTHAFLLFAFAAAHRLTGEARLRTIVDKTLDFMDRHLADPVNGGLRDRHPEPAAAKAQNPQMHLLEALLALHDRFPDGSYLERAGGVVDLFAQRMLDPELGLLAEHFGTDWSQLGEAVSSRCFEPGHHFEWIWLLDQYRAASGRCLPEVAERLWESGCAAGVGAAGLVFDEVGFDRRPKAGTHRLWPHAEGARAAAVRVASGDREAAKVATTMLRALNEVFLGSPFPGGWVDRVDAGPKPLLDTVPASSLYHLYGAWLAAEKVFGPGATLSSDLG